MTNVAILANVDPDPDVDDDEWLNPSSVGLLANLTGSIINLASFISEGTHTEPTIGQIWPR